MISICFMFFCCFLSYIIMEIRISLLIWLFSQIIVSWTWIKTLFLEITSVSVTDSHLFMFLTWLWLRRVITRAWAFWVTSFLFFISSGDRVTRPFLLLSNIIGKAIRLYEIVKFSRRFSYRYSLFGFLIRFSCGRIGGWPWGTIYV